MNDIPMTDTPDGDESFEDRPGDREALGDASIPDAPDVIGTALGALQAMLGPAPSDEEPGENQTGEDPDTDPPS
ncbi:MAG: hypothetical protein BRD52_04145 [Bacteroidetes bacterium SW_4_67_19]|nr:MAG: hypothetical protein BRD52_04145 [Bacteroidetes bacterium SW_4_67_19]